METIIFVRQYGAIVMLMSVLVMGGMGTEKTITPAAPPKKLHLSLLFFVVAIVTVYEVN